jgi:hypothetical protein
LLLFSRKRVTLAAVQTIAEIIARLEAIIAECTARNDRAGYFAVLYHRVTKQVAESIARGEFEDGARMERLDVIFANHYIRAYDDWRAGRAPVASWKLAFDTTANKLPLVLQHLLLGMNAHINLDLSLATVETMQGYPLEDIYQDFNEINRILGNMSARVEDQLTRVNPLLRLLHLEWLRSDDMLVRFSIQTARKGAWQFALELSRKDDRQFAACVRTRDALIAELGQTIARPCTFSLRMMLPLIRLFEPKKAATIIRLLGE